jgi:hypothetical protein
VQRLSTADGSRTTLAENQSRPTTLAVDAVSVYWTNHDSGEIARTPK